jgi:hypothetical protein
MAASLKKTACNIAPVLAFLQPVAKCKQLSSGIVIRRYKPAAK